MKSVEERKIPSGKEGNTGKGFLARHGYAFLLLGASLCLGLPIFFVRQTVLAGIFTLFGLFLFMVAGRMARKGKDVLFCCLAFSVSLVVRYGRAFAACGIWDCLISYGVFFLYAALLSGSFAAEYFLGRGKARLLVPFVFPSCYALVCLFACLLSLGSLLNPLTYLFLWPSLGGTLPYLTEFGLTFFLLLFASFLIEAFFAKGKKGKAIDGAMSFLIAFALLLAGSLSIPWNAEPSYSLKVSLGLGEKQTVFGEHDGAFAPEDGLSLLEEELASSQKEGAELFVTNEEFLSFPRSEEAAYLTRVSSLVAEYHIPTLLCADESGEGEALSLNKAYFLSAKGEVLCSYQKTSLVPVIEGDYEKGDGKPGCVKASLGGHEVTLSFLICADLNNGLLARSIPSETELLIAPSWDWDDANAEQLRTSSRAMEAKTTLLKHTYEGYSFAATPKGEVRETQDNRGVYSTIRAMSVPIYEKA